MTVRARSATQLLGTSRAHQTEPEVASPGRWKGTEALVGLAKDRVIEDHARDVRVRSNDQRGLPMIEEDGLVWHLIKIVKPL